MRPSPCCLWGESRQGAGIHLFRSNSCYPRPVSTIGAVQFPFSADAPCASHPARAFDDFASPWHAPQHLIETLQQTDQAQPLSLHRNRA